MNWDIRRLGKDHFWCFFLCVFVINARFTLLKALDLVNYFTIVDQVGNDLADISFIPFHSLSGMTVGFFGKPVV